MCVCVGNNGGLHSSFAEMDLNLQSHDLLVQTHALRQPVTIEMKCGPKPCTLLRLYVRCLHTESKICFSGSTCEGL